MRVKLNKTGFVHHGSITSINGVTSDHRAVTVHCDWRPAEAIIEALLAGETVYVDAEPWQVFTRIPRGRR